MKMRLLLAIAGVALAAEAQAQTYGQASLAFTHNESNLDFGVLAPSVEIDTDIFQVEGSVAFDLGALRAQVDGRLVDSNAFDPVGYGTGHLTGRVGSVLMGGFAGVQASENPDWWILGAEAHAPVGAQTFVYGQVGRVIDDGPLDVETWLTRAELRHYLSDNLVLTGGLGYGRTEVGGTDSDQWTASVEGEYQFTGSPLSVFGGYRRTEDDFSQSDGLQIGVRYNFGGSILERERSGARLNNTARLSGGL